MNLMFQQSSRGIQGLHNVRYSHQSSCMMIRLSQIRWNASSSSSKSKIWTKNSVRRMVSSSRSRSCCSSINSRSNSSISSSGSSVSLDTTNSVVEKISARVFCEVKGNGGNPVTIFLRYSKDPFPLRLRSQLAQTCSWESVFVHSSCLDKSYSDHDDDDDASKKENMDDDSNTNNTVTKCSSSIISNGMNFHLPSGEEISFCVHAALGGVAALSLSSKSSTRSSSNGDSSSSSRSGSSSSDSTSENLKEVNQVVQFYVESNKHNNNNNNNTNNNNNNNNKTIQEENDTDGKEYFQSIVHNPHNIVSLEMKNVSCQEETVEHSPMLYRMLRMYHNLDNFSHLQRKPKVAFGSNEGEMAPYIFPSFRNVSLFQRTKTLIYVDTLDVLNNVLQPPSLEPSRYKSFQALCDGIDTTGLYFFTPRLYDDGEPMNTTFECRQFPRSSGYAEDPATGLAAAALAISLASSTKNILSSFNFHQGHAMGHPSLIRIEDVKLDTNFFDSTENSVDDNKQQSSSTKHDDDDSDEIRKSFDDDEDDYNVEDDDDEESEPTTAPSRAEVFREINKSRSHVVSFRIMGKVEIDNQMTITINDEW